MNANQKSRVTITRRHTGRYHIGLNDADMGVLAAIVIRLGELMLDDLQKDPTQPQELKDSANRIITTFKRFEKTL